MPTHLPRRHTPLIAWMLYCSVLFSAWMCAIGHGQMTGMQLSGLNTQFCSLHADPSAQDTLEHSSTSAMTAATGSDCMLTSLFSAILLAALFGLLALLSRDTGRSLPVLNSHCAPRDRWPLANPRASPALLPPL